MRHPRRLLKFSNYLNFVDNNWRGQWHSQNSDTQPGSFICQGIFDVGVYQTTLDCIMGGYHESVLHIALGRNFKAIAQLLIKHGADVNADGGYCGSPLQIASRRGQEGVVELLIKNGAGVNAQGAFGRGPLHVASSQGHEGIVRLLIENGADVDMQAEFYGSPAQIASSIGNEVITRLLLDWDGC